MSDGSQTGSSHSEGSREDRSLYGELSRILRAAGIEVRTASFKTPSASAGGLCSVEGRLQVLLDSGASRGERVVALLESVEQLGLQRLGIDGSHLSPSLLSRLNRRGQMEWPHRSQAPSVAKGWASAPSLPLRLMHTPPPLRRLTTMQLGGAPSRLERLTRTPELVELVTTCRRDDEPLFVLGGGSNVVVADAGVSGTVVTVDNREIHVDESRGRVRVTVGAGYDWHEFAAEMTAAGFSGLECLGGIPGCVGATPVQNVGAYGQEVSQTIHAVQVLNRRTMKLSWLPREACEFGYRTSVFKTKAKDEYIVLAVTFELTPGGAPSLAYGELTRSFEGTTSPSLPAVFERVVELRRNKSMVLDPEDPNGRSCGSFFVNAQVSTETADAIEARVGRPVPRFPAEDGRVKIPSAWLIEQAGLEKGTRQGPVGLSSKHTLCIVAHDGATSADVVDLAWTIRRRVEQAFGVRLIPEPHFWGFGPLDDGLPHPSDGGSGGSESDPSLQKNPS